MNTLLPTDRMPPLALKAGTAADTIEALREGWRHTTIPR
jgi:hypothetical protein